MGKASKKPDKIEPKSDVKTTETASHGRGRGRKQPARGRGVPPVDAAPAPPTESLTRDSSSSSQRSNNVAAIASDEHGSGSPPKSKKKKVTNPTKSRKINKPATISEAKEILMVEWLRENPMVWNPKLNAYKDTGKRLKRWEDQSQVLDPSHDEIKDGACPCDIHVKLDKDLKSGADARELASMRGSCGSITNSTSRRASFGTVSVRTALQNTGGDLTAAEAAYAEQAADGATGDTTPDLELTCTSRVATKRSLDAADRYAYHTLIVHIVYIFY